MDFFKKETLIAVGVFFALLVLLRAFLGQDLVGMVSGLIAPAPSNGAQ